LLEEGEKEKIEKKREKKEINFFEKMKYY